MSRYAFDSGRRALVVSWATGAGDVAVTVAMLPVATSESDALRLAEQLTFLAAAAWRTYTHPASATLDLTAGSEGWRRHGDRAAFVNVLTAIRHPHLPRDGAVLQSYVMVDEAAHRAGRALHAIGDSELTDRVVVDVRAELDAIEQAERGELSGRARQAIALTRADASPVQVAAADVVLAGDPFGDARLFTEVDPVAAAVAAAHWLYAAATVTARRVGLDPGQVVVEADNIEALAHESPTVVLERMDAGETPRQVVLGLIADAMVVAGGKIPDLDGLLAMVEEAHVRADSLGERAEEAREALMPRRLTPLDPARPAMDLLEDLLSGIHGCWLLYREYADDADDVDDMDTDPADTADTVDTGLDDVDDSTTGELRDEQVAAVFLAEARAEAAVRRFDLL